MLTFYARGMSMSGSVMPTPFRSTFVTVLAWVFIGLAGFMSLIILMQNLMMQLLFLPLMQQHAFPMPPPWPNVSPITTWWFAHVIWILRALLLLALMTLTAAIGLLFRKEWARRLLMGLMVCGALYQCAGAVAQWWFPPPPLASMLPPHAPPNVVQTMQDFSSIMQDFFDVARVLSVLSAIGLCGLFGWIIRRLCSAPIRAEFQRTALHLQAPEHTP